MIYAALIGNGLIALTKFGAAALTGSSAMLSEGIHSLVDTGNQVLLLYGLKRAKRPPDEQFPFGHGKEIYFWSFVVAIVIFALGSGISLYEGIVHLSDHGEVKAPQVNYIVLALAFVFESVAWYLAFVEFNRDRGKRHWWRAISKGKDPTLFIVLFEDTAALLGIITAFLGIWLTSMTQNPMFDALASIGIGLILGVTAIVLAIETKGLLIGESASTEVVRGIRHMVQEYDLVNNVNEVLTLHMGPEFILVNLSVDFIDSTNAHDIERIAAELDKAIKLKYPLVKRVFIEAEHWVKDGAAPTVAE